MRKLVKMKIEDLTPGFRLYKVTRNGYNWYDYFCPMPVKNPTNEGRYFILIDKRIEEPVRMYVKDLQRLLDEGIFTLEAALDEQIKLTEEWLNFLKESRKNDL